MKNSPKMALLPSLTLAFGILAATKVSTLTIGSPQWVLLGPFLLAAAILAAGFQSRWLQLSSSRSIWVPWVTAGIVIVASAIVAFRDPSRVASVLPLLGASGFFVVMDERISARRCLSRAD